MIRLAFYIGWGALFHWLIWGEIYYGLASIAFVTLWPFFVLFYIIPFLIAVALVTLFLIGISELFKKITG